jgi:hypothetical protein
MKQNITLDQWIALSMQERKVIMDVFHMQRSAGFSVSDGQIVSDGVTPKDLLVVNIGRMIEYIGAEDDSFCDELWDLVKNKALKKDVQTSNQQPSV